MDAVKIFDGEETLNSSARVLSLRTMNRYEKDLICNISQINDFLSQKNVSQL